MSAYSDLKVSSGPTEEVYTRTRRRKRVIKKDWKDFFDGLTKTLDHTERNWDWVVYREGLRNQRYYDGEYFWRFSDESGLMRDLPHSDDDPFFPHNYFAYFADLSIAAALEASPDIIIDPVGRDDRNRSTARAAQSLGDHCERELLTGEFRLESEKLRQLYGGVWWYSYWDADAGIFSNQPVYGDTIEKSGGSAWMCGHCQDMGPSERLAKGACPTCHRWDGIIAVQGPTRSIEQITRYDRVPAGFPVVEPVTVLQMKGDRRAGNYMRGSYLRRRRFIDRDVIASLIPWWDPERGSEGGSGDDYGLRIEELARRPHDTLSQTPLVALGIDSADTHAVVVEQWWFRPAKYEWIEFDKPQVFIGEEEIEIPANVRLGEVFPEGLYKLKVGNDWVDHRNEDFRRHWVYLPYISRTHKPDGKSLKDMAEPQREIIEANSLLFLYLKARSGGAPTIIKSPLSETAFDGSPETITRLSAGYGGALSDLFFQPQFPPADPALWHYISSMAGEMQITGQVVSPSQTGDPASMEMGATNTARGMMIMNAKAQGLQGPKLMPAAYAQSIAYMQWIDLFRKNFAGEIPVPLKSSGSGKPEWAMISSADLEGDIFAYPRPQSWIPHPREERQAAMANAFTVFGQLLLDPNTPKGLTDAILEAYGLELELGDRDESSRNAMLRIMEMEDRLPKFEAIVEMMLMFSVDQVTVGALNPTEIVSAMLVEAVPADPELDDHQAFEDYYRRWLRGEEGRSAPPALNAAVRIHWTTHRDALQQAAEEQKKSMAEQLEMAERAKLGADLEREKARSEARLSEAIAKGQITAGLKALEPTPTAPAPEPDTAERDAGLEAGLESVRSDLRMREMMAKGIIDAALRPPQQAGAKKKPNKKPERSKAGVGGSIVSNAPMVPGLPGIPSQPAI